MPTGTSTVLDVGPGVLDVGPGVLDVGVSGAAGGQLDVVVPQRVAATETATCVCGHGRDAHEHYRRGNDCALCACLRFRRRR